MSASGSLKAFAERRDLRFREHGSLPAQGNLLSRGGRVEGVVDGTLPGGVEGSLAYYTYEYTTTDSDGHTESHTRRFTLVVTSVPQSIGFMPSLGFAGAESEMSGVGGKLEEVVRVDLGGHAGLKGSRCYRYKGAGEMWTRRLFSPGFVDWLARSEPDLGFELSSGVLTTSRAGHLVGDDALAGLCEEAAHLTGVIAAESDEDSDIGTAAGNAARDPKANDPRTEAALRAVAVDPPPSVNAALRPFRRHVASSPRTIGRALWYAALVTLVLNIPGAAIPILLAVAGSWALLAAIEAFIVAIFFFFIYRKDVRESSAKYAAEAFWAAYAKARDMKLEEPLRFAATHAQAKLRWKPDRVLAGPLPAGGEGCFCVLGDGSKRADRVAVVAGPAGPIAESELEAEPQGLTAKDLDAYLEQLSGEVRVGTPEGARA
ncbi:MAG TPA: hypothetical protein VG518_10915 [Solirubrobacterales bacterium]|nr:hypothetical protein [Solirubrobacterales bacterium]HWB70476.1 hypothetical protein [Solirubrobacterales bacterium]